MPTLLSIDWDAFSGCREFVFDAPIWGTPDREHDRVQAWRQRALKRDASARGWQALEGDFPLYSGWQALSQYAGVPSFVAHSHAHAWSWLEQFPGREVINIDSHHDLYAQSGARAQLRPGNWAGLSLQRGMMTRYTTLYPSWHGDLKVTEGYDLARTWDELAAVLDTATLQRVQLASLATLPAPESVEALLLVQSPAWCSPQHDAPLMNLAATLGATPISAPYLRPWSMT